jgi:hypothetical protein
MMYNDLSCVNPCYLLAMKVIHGKNAVAKFIQPF